ncbi:SusC/RagA family TonB-linked outer membrane protein [Tenacibaculum sp. 190524A02b]|uniref:SusC/RagA family TonB-linked outer membrane protein n=1 Tax=Tenacibaculum vairaonense TaxID=3137860 RepID=UPI0031FA6BE0
MNKKLYLSFLTLLITSVGMFAQKTVTGIVKDSTGPLPGVSVVEKGTTNGVETDFEGNYKLKVKDNNSILVFSFIGMKNQEILVSGKSIIDVLLKEDSQQLDEIVVNALGIRVDKRTLGATVSKVKAEALETSGETSVINSLQAKASGVRIARSNGDPGAGSSIQIRGANTIFGNTQPLIIIDGVPVSNDYINGSNASAGGTVQQSRLNDINDDDIESINILKGASAAAIWGSAAANGVLVITTKRGRDTGKVNVEYKTSLSIDQLATFHPLQSVYGQGSGGNWRINNSRSWGDKIDDRSGAADEFYTKVERGYFVGAQSGNEYLLIKTKNSKETFRDKNKEAIFQDAFSTKHNLSISGAGGKGNYRFSIGYVDQEGIIRTSDYKKLNVGFTGKYEFNDKFDVTTSTQYANTTSNRIQQSSNTAGVLLGLLRGAPDFDNTDYIGDYYDSNGVLTPLAHRAYRSHIGAGIPAYNNPLWTLYRQKSPTEVDRIILSTDFNYKTNDWLNLKLRSSYDTYSDERRYFFPIFSAGTGRTTGQFRLDNINNSIFNLDLIATTNSIKLSENINSSYILGYNFNDQNRKSVYNRGENFITNTTLQSFSITTEILPPRNLIRKLRSFRFFGAANFDYKNQLYLNLSAAFEKASSIKGGFFYPSVDASWQFTQLPSLKDNNVLTKGKLRFGVGQVGVRPRPHLAQTVYVNPSFSDYSDPLDIEDFGGGLGFSNTLGNPNLKPEIKTEYEVGFDLGLFNKLDLGFTYYYNKVNDVILPVPISPSFGASRRWDNGASLQNKGIELDVNYNFLKSQDLNMSFYGNFNNNKNKVLSLKGAESIALTDGSVSSRAVVGHAMGALWGTRAKRNPDGSFDLDANGFPQQAVSQGVIGDPNPDWRGGFGLRGNYKKFNFNILFEHSQGGDFSERTRFILGNFGTHADVGNEVIPSVDVKDLNGNVYPAGTPVRGNIRDFGAGPVLLNQAWYTTRGGGFGSSPINEFTLYNKATWTRLSEVTVGYTLNSEWFRKKTKLASVDFTLTGRNLALWTDILGVDPQTNQTGVGNGFGIDYFTNPASKTYLLTIKIKY